MGKSRQVIELLLADMKTTIDDDEVIWEKYRERAEDMEPRQDVTKIRVSLYNEDEDSIVKIDSEKPADSIQRYAIDINVLRAYRGDNADNHELVALDMKDEIIEWIKTVNAYSVTNGAISSFGYDGATGFLRRNRYATMTLRCSGQKILTENQTL